MLKLIFAISLTSTEFVKLIPTKVSFAFAATLDVELHAGAPPAGG